MNECILYGVLNFKSKHIYSNINYSAYKVNRQDYLLKFTFTTNPVVMNNYYKQAKVNFLMNVKTEYSVYVLKTLEDLAVKSFETLYNSWLNFLKTNMELDEDNLLEFITKEEFNYYVDNFVVITETSTMCKAINM